MDYQRLMGVERLAESCRGGEGVKIAILDSGMPKPSIFGWPFRFRDGKPDEFGHATAVSSILFGGWGIKGVCECACPYYYSVLDDTGSGSVKSVSRGIMRALDDDVDIINLSLGFVRTEECPKELEKACKKAYKAGKTIICAAGNDGGPVNWPAALGTTISVGSAGGNGLKTAFSSVGEVDFVAPGTNLSVICPDGRIKTVSGTSFSSALVTGVATLLFWKIRHEYLIRPNMNYMLSALKGLSNDVSEPGWDKTTGYGFISGKNADSTVCMKIEQGFFGKIIAKMQSLVGFGKTKEKNDGRV